MGETKTKRGQLDAAAKYIAKFESCAIRFPMGTRKRIQALGYKSVNAFAVMAAMEKLEREEKMLGKQQS